MDTYLIVYFLFYDRETGEEFIVEECEEIEPNLNKMTEGACYIIRCGMCDHAFEVARRFFHDPHMARVITAEEVEETCLNIYSAP